MRQEGAEGYQPMAPSEAVRVHLVLFRLRDLSELYEKFSGRAGFCEFARKDMSCRIRRGCATAPEGSTRIKDGLSGLTVLEARLAGCMC